MSEPTAGDNQPKADMSRKSDILLVSTADWDNPFWTNKQHVAVQLAKRGHKVFYIESQGLRAPTATGKDLRRIWKRLKRGLKPPRQVRPGLWVWSPIVIPFHGKAIARKINRVLLQSGMRFWCALNRIKPSILWTYSPLTTELYDLDRFPLVVYHAVDDIKAQPGMPRETIARAEDDLSRRADVIFTSAPNLQEVHERLNPATHYFSNVADYDHFNKALDPATRIPDDIAAIPRPRLGFVGAISSYKLDFEMIRAIADAHPHWSFVFVGDIGEGDPLTDATMLRGATNIHILGGRPYAQLPAYLKAIDVALLPNQINEYTKSMFPMKFFEYLAAGKPIVATELPALADYSHLACLCKDRDAFVAAIEGVLVGQGATLDERLATARQHTYELRTQKMMQIVEAIQDSSLDRSMNEAARPVTVRSR